MDSVAEEAPLERRPEVAAPAAPETSATESRDADEAESGTYKESSPTIQVHAPASRTSGPGGSDASPSQPLLRGHEAPPTATETSVVVSRAEVEEAVEDMRQYGASLVKPVANAVEVTRAHGASVLEKGAEAAEAARRQAEAFRKAGADVAQSSADMWQQGTEVARANWQHGAEACQRGLSEASTAWRGAAPYVDKAILLVNVTMAITIGGFIILGIMLVCMPLMPERAHHGPFDRMFWVTQGLYLIAFSVPALVATVQCGILRNGFENWPSWMRAELWLGILKFQLGRAVFFVGAGFYVFPLMDNFGLMAKVELWAVCLSYLLGIVSLLSGSFLLIFDVVLSVYVHQAMYDKVEERDR